ncbi:MAG: ComEA family DNA-binding protein, partial [Halothiobacillus sp.]
VIRAFVLGVILMLGMSSAYAVDKLDLNSATAEQLQSVKGIGPKLAQAIEEYRKTHHGFKSVEELKEVKGIGEKNYITFKEHFVVEAAKSATPTKK